MERHVRGKQYRLSSMDGIKDIKISHATVQAREKGDFSKDGSASQPGVALDDEKARAERYGIDLDHSGDIGLGLS